MLVISDGSAATFLERGLRQLRGHILSHWQESLRSSGERAGEDGRSHVLSAIERMAREEPDLTVAELTALADLMLVDAVNQKRTAAEAR